MDAARLEHDGVLAEIPASPRTATSDESGADAAFHTAAGDATYIRGQPSTRSKPMVSCGPPLPGVEVIVVDPETFQIVPEGTVGKAALFAVFQMFSGVPQMAVNGEQVCDLEYIDGQICHTMVPYGD